MPPAAAAPSDAIELPDAAPPAAELTAASASSLSFAPLLSASSLSASSAVSGTIGSTAHPHLIAGGMSSGGASSPASSASSSSSSSATLQLPSDWRSAVETLKAKRLQRHFRPVSVFADVSRFSRPVTGTEAWTRLELNLQWFWLNYLSIAVVLLLLAVLSQPSFLLTVLVLAALWAVALSRETLSVPGVHRFVLAGKAKLYTLYALSALLLLLFAGSTILMIAGLTGVTVCLHAVLHHTPSQQERDAAEEEEEMQMPVV